MQKSGRRLQPHYKVRAEGTAYFCPGDFPHVGESSCQRLIAKAVDELVSRLVLDVVQTGYSTPAIAIALNHEDVNVFEEELKEQIGIFTSILLQFNNTKLTSENLLEL